MTKRRISTAILLILLAGVSVLAQTSETAEARLRTELEPQINDAIRKGRLPGFTLGVVKNGKFALRLSLSAV
jgi:hypothetical protein